MDKVKKVYVDSRFRSRDSASNSDFKFELNEALVLPDNTVCYVDDISIPHTWRTIESHDNKLYIIFKTEYLAGGGSEMYAAYNHDAYVLEIPEGNYTGPALANAIQELLSFAVSFEFEVVYNGPRGSITIKSNYVGMLEKSFIIPTDFGILTWSSQGPDYLWVNLQGIPTSVDNGAPNSISGVLRNSDNDGLITVNTDSDFYRTYESGFLDLLSIHNIYMHCENLGHFNSIGVRGENSIIKKIPVSSSFGYLILDSVVSTHDKMDVSRQNVKTVHISLKDVYGNVINLHGASCSFSLVFVTSE